MVLSVSLKIFSRGSDSMWAAHKQAGKHMGKQIKQNDYWLLLAFVSEAFYDHKKKKKNGEPENGGTLNLNIYNIIEVMKQPQIYSIFPITK